MVRWASLRARPSIIASMLVFALAGVMFAAAASSSQGTDLRSQRASELSELVGQKSDAVEALERDVAARQSSVDDISAGRSGDPVAADLRTDIALARESAGLAAITGKALRVTLDDAPIREPSDPLWQTLTPNDVIVHQSDVEAVINALWRGGAEGIQVMDQRLINTSSVQCVGNTLLLQGRVYSPPYVITAVGPLKAMRMSLWQDPGVADYRDWAGAVGLGYDIERLPDYMLPAYEGPISMDFASPDAVNGASPAS